MSCSRKSCSNIMCDTYVDNIGYVCNECKEEFKEYLHKLSIRATTEGEINRALEKFMETRKDDYKEGNKMDVDEFFRGYTRD